MFMELEETSQRELSLRSREVYCVVLFTIDCFVPTKKVCRDSFIFLSGDWEVGIHGEPGRDEEIKIKIGPVRV